MSYTLSPATQADIPALIALYFTSFTTSLLRQRLKPDVPPIREWMTKRFIRDMSDASSPVLYYKIILTPAERESEETKIVAMAKWSRHVPKEEGKQASTDGADHVAYPNKDGDVEMFNHVMSLVNDKRTKLIGNDQEYMYLHILATHPNYTRQGLGSLLMREFIKQTDERNCIAYLEASPLGRGLYEKFGFETRDTFSIETNGKMVVDCCMVRERA